MNWLDKFIVSERGQWDYPGYPTAVPTKNGRITMEGVPYPVMGFVLGQPPVMMQPGKNYKFPGKMVYEIPVAQKGLQTPSDSLAYQLNKIADYEYARGSASGTGLSNFGNPALGNNPTKQQAVNWMMQNTVPIVNPYFTSPTEQAEATDFVYNTGRDPRIYMLDQYLKSIGQSGLQNRGSYNIDINDPANAAKWKTKKSELDKIWNEHSGNISKLSENDRRVLLNKGRDFYYRNINVKPDGSPSDAYYNTWYGRIWNTNDYAPFDPNNPKFTAPRKKEGGHIVPGRYRNPEGNWVSKYASGGDISIPDLSRPNWLEKYQKKGQVTSSSNTKYFTDYNDYVKANQAYQDSLSLYDSEALLLNAIRNKSLTSQQISDYQGRNNDQWGPLKINHPSGYVNDPKFNYTTNSTSSQTSGIWPFQKTTTTTQPWRVMKWTKPTQPVAYVQGSSNSKPSAPPSPPVPPRPPVPKNIKSKEAVLQAPEDRLVREYNTLVLNEDYRRVYDKSPYSLREYGPEGKPTHWAKEDEKIPGIWRPIKDTPSDIFVSKKVKFNTGGWLDKYQGDTQSSQVKTYESDPSYFDNRAIYHDDSRFNDLIRSKVYAGTHGWDPTTNSLVKLDKPVAVPEAVREMSTPEWGKKTSKERFESNTPAGKATRKAVAAREMEQAVTNPYFRGAIPGMLAAPALAAAGPAVLSALNAPAVVGSTALPGVTAANAIGLGMGAYGAYNLGQDVDTGYYGSDAPTSDKVIRGLETGLNLLGTPGAMEATVAGLSKAAKPIKNAYNTVATGESFLPVAWKSPAVGLSQSASDDMFRSLANSGKLTPEERALVLEYQSNSGKFTGRGFNKVNPEKREALNNLIKKHNLNIGDDVVLTRMFGNREGALGTNLENGRLNFGDRPTSFTAGVRPSAHGSANNRLVIPRRYSKQMGENFLVNQYDQPSDETLNLLDDKVREFSSGISSNPNLQNERELIGTGLDFKQIGKVKNDLGGYDLIVKPNTPRQSIGQYLTTQTPLKNAYKYNPWAFKANENNWYRQVGQSAIDDASQMGLVREAGEEVSPRMWLEFDNQIKRLRGDGIEDYYEKMKQSVLASRRPASPFFAKGELFYPMGRKPTTTKTGKVSKNPAGKGSSDYLIETSLPNESFQPAYVKGMDLGVPEEIGATAILKPNPDLRNLENFNFYKQDWLRGYKPITVSKKPSNSEELDMIRALLKEENNYQVEKARNFKSVQPTLAQNPYSTKLPTLTKEEEIIQDSYNRGWWSDDPAFWRWYNKKHHKLDYDRPIKTFYDPSDPASTRSNPSSKKKLGGWLDKYQVGKEVKSQQNQKYQDAIKWHEDWMNSPMYKQMLYGDIEQSKYPSDETLAGNYDAYYFDAKRKNRLSDLKQTPLDVRSSQPGPGYEAEYSPLYNEIRVYPDGYNSPTVMHHEIRHGIEVPKYQVDDTHFNMPAKDYSYLQTLNTNRNFQNAPLTKQDVFGDEKIWNRYKDYYTNPSEVNARLAEIRKQAQDQKVYDPFTQPIPNDFFKNFDNRALQELKNYYSDEEIQHMLNHFSYNQTQPNDTGIYQSKLGGKVKLKKYQRIGEVKQNQTPPANLAWINQQGQFTQVPPPRPEPVTVEGKVNKFLGEPMHRAQDLASSVVGLDEDPVDNLRHSAASMYLTDQFGSSLGAAGMANALGMLHEYRSLPNAIKRDGVYHSLMSTAEDLFNNAVGSGIGMLPLPIEAKESLLIYLTNNNMLPDGVSMPEGNMYWKKKKGGEPYPSLGYYEYIGGYSGIFAKGGASSKKSSWLNKYK